MSSGKGQVESRTPQQEPTHLNAVLRSTRNVKEGFIVDGKDPGRLLRNSERHA